MKTKLQTIGPVKRLVELGVCSLTDITSAIADAKRLSTPESQRKIREAERLFDMLGDSNRIKILLLLSKREMCVCEIESALRLSQPTVSHNLALLEQAELVSRSKRGKWAFYKTTTSPVLDIVRRKILGGE